MTQPLISDEEKLHFRINDFPKTNSSRREFIFARTGFSAKPLNHRGWSLFNNSMNNGLQLQLTEQEVQILSLMDSSLSRVKRFARVPNMHEIASDSTAAHTKQTMNIIQHIFEKAFADAVPKTIEPLRRDALISAWLHDMGEIVTELATANDMFLMNSDKERQDFSAAKNMLERQITNFACELGAMCVKKGDKTLFINAIDRLRQVAESADNASDKITRLSQTITSMTAELHLPGEPSDITKKFMALYDKVEEKSAGNFIHPLVKTLESVEGQRYLQRNSSLLPYTGLELTTSNEIIKACERCEKRLPELFANATNTELKKLARATAEFTYRSLARTALPKIEDHVSQIPVYIKRNPAPNEEVPASALIPAAHIPHYLAITRKALESTGLEESEQERILSEIRTKSLEDTRAQWTESLQSEHERLNATSMNKPIYSRAEYGYLYRAAEAAVSNRIHPFVPKSASLISFDATPEIPNQLIVEINKVRKQHEQSSVARFPSRK